MYYCITLCFFEINMIRDIHGNLTHSKKMEEFILTIELAPFEISAQYIDDLKYTMYNVHTPIKVVR